MIKAVYPGTFDPLTRGHEDLVRRAAPLFDSIILAIADSKAKKPYFTLDERIAMAREVLGDLKNVQVRGLSRKAAASYFWQRGQKKVERCPCTSRLIAVPQRWQALPSRSYTRWRLCESPRCPSAPT